MGPTKLLFVHLRKSAGSTVRRSLRAYGRTTILPNHYTDPEESRRALIEVAGGSEGVPGVWVGHVLLEPDITIAPDVDVFTVVREPMERVLSHIAWMNVRRLDQGRNPLDPLDAVRAKIPSDLQTRVLAGVAPGASIGPDALERAAVVLDRCVVVGVTERLSESMALLGHRLGRQPVAFTSQNRTPGRDRETAPSDELLDAVAQRNQLDAQLHDLARERLDRDLASAGPGFELLAAALAQANAAIERP